MRTLVAVVVLLLLAPVVCAQPVRIQPLMRVTPGGTVRGYLACVDLTDPTLDVVVTSPTGTSCEANALRTDTWRSANSINLAINANYFATVSGSCLDVVGLSVSNGVTVSPYRQFGANPDPALVFRAGNAEIGYIGPAGLAGVVDAVAGVGPSTTDTDPGTLLVTAGINTGATARVDPAVRNPRTAVGLTQDRSQLIIAVIDGRQNNWSVGMTLPELADLLIERGAWNAVNLDGGDSSSFVYQAPGTSTVIANRPSGSGNQHRAVASHLGFRWPAPAPTPTPRPVRGAWLRPPSTVAQLEVNLAQFAAAGVTDLYIETFYHGLATNNSNVFPDRFATDYLADAIVAAARYNIRVHAWLESAYWQFGTSGAQNFASNPEWRAFNVDTQLNGGDGTAGQIFANLANPGVQQKMADYCTELAGCTGLWGIQTDYHRFPLDNDTGDNATAPWSYDSWSRAQFLAMYGADINTTAVLTSGSHWYRFLSWRRAGISQAARRMQEAIRAANPSIDFSAAMFATAMSSSAQVAKCQDWPTWATNAWVQTLIPMAYGSTTASIQSDMNTTLGSASGRRVVAGLAITGASPHPTITAQLNTIRGVGVESFVFFDGSAFTEQAKRDELAFWLLNTATRQPADFDADLDVDGDDRAFFANVYQGTPVPVNAGNARYNLNTDSVINETDRLLFDDYFRRYRFGENGVLDLRDIAAITACLGATPAVPGVPHLYDLDGDDDVDLDDLDIARSLATVPLTDPHDVDGDGNITIEDLYAQHRAPVDVDGNQSIDEADADAVESLLRLGEKNDLRSPR
ncbi:MAG: phosphodiester glycosidase family protein [Phycisphaerales bacterium]